VAYAKVRKCAHCGRPLSEARSAKRTSHRMRERFLRTAKFCCLSCKNHYYNALYDARTKGPPL